LVKYELESNIWHSSSIFTHRI